MVNAQWSMFNVQWSMVNVQNGPLPIHDVVVSAVAAAVMAATITFNSTSQNLELFIR